MVEKKVDNYEIEIDKSRMKKKRSEDISTAEGVFDLSTRKVIFNLMKKKIIYEIFGVISTGKEANVYRAIDIEGNPLAIKIYRIRNPEIQFMWKYIEGDPRFLHVRKKPRNIVFAWAEKEYKNLSRAAKANVRVPKVIISIENVLVMEFIGKNNIAAPKLKDVEIKNPSKIFNIIIEYMRKLYTDAHLVHGDLSEFNILMDNNNPVIIDISQAVPLDHPNSNEFLIRDVKNIHWFFKQTKLELSTPQEIYKYIKTGE